MHNRITHIPPTFDNAYVDTDPDTGQALMGMSVGPRSIEVRFDKGVAVNKQWAILDNLVRELF